ncbi:MAG: GIY-YIG nuclease family protein [Pseudomonadota bacterium]|nr:GIY-YIG nuclease family protein [Pseudomonadota bacterium]
MEKDKLLALIQDDDLGLLNTKAKASGAVTPDERLIASFLEINDFMRKHEREPEANSKDVHEFKLHKRLDSFRSDDAKATALLEHDEFGLLANRKKIASINDVFADDDLGILDDGTDSIFTLKHVPKEINAPDYVAQRKPCKDFKEFEPLFKQCHADLTAGKRKLRPFAKAQQIDKGLFFVLKGILLYVDKVGPLESINGRTNARLRVIFDNGTESDMLLRSLSAELYKDGRRVTAHDDDLLEDFETVTEGDTSTGYIYILRSLSENQDIHSIQHLYKIGFSTMPVAERIKNAAQEPTYLNAPVKIISAYQCYNLNPQKLEQLLHTFFGKACLDVDLYDREGKRYVPREWFIAPREVIEQAVTLLINGEIVHYQYDADKQEIVERE